MITGNLTLKPISAKLTHDTSSFGTMDPYVIVKYENQEHTSTVAKKAGKFPSWEDSFCFRMAPNNNIITVVVMDKDTMSSDDFVGEGNLVVDTKKEGKDT